eukprot:COSAG02_NODE_2923_length_7743_cov_6.813448_5_plen_160_part_00
MLVKLASILFWRAPVAARATCNLLTHSYTSSHCRVLSKLKAALLERAGLAPRTEAPSQWEAEEQPIVPGPHGVVDPKKVVLHKMVARGMYASIVADADVLLTWLKQRASPTSHSVYVFILPRRYILLITCERRNPPAGGILGARSAKHHRIPSGRARGA